MQILTKMPNKCLFAFCCIWLLHLIHADISQLYANSQPTYYYYPAPRRAFKTLTETSEANHRSNVIQQQQQHIPQQQHNQLHYQSPIVKQFVSPALENVAFTMALTSQGYNLGSIASSLSTSSSSSSSAYSSSSSSSSSTKAAAGPAIQVRSLNVKLPLNLNFGVTPININPLPLQGGAPYDAVPRDLTSYGTPYPQRI